MITLTTIFAVDLTSALKKILLLLWLPMRRHGSEADALIKWGRMTVTAEKSTSTAEKVTCRNEPLYLWPRASASQGCHICILELSKHHTYLTVSLQIFRSVIYVPSATAAPISRVWEAKSCHLHFPLDLHHPISLLATLTPHRIRSLSLRASGSCWYLLRGVAAAVDGDRQRKKAAMQIELSTTSVAVAANIF